jgi:SAM-dependent methyltransferase
MGVDSCVLEAILKACKYTPSNGDVLTLGRQGVHISFENISQIARQYGVEVPRSVVGTYCENLLTHLLNAKTVTSLDNSSYENATIIHDMNSPVERYLYNKFDFILDGGTIEHIFNIPQVCQNVIDLLKVGGVFCSITTNNNFSGHGLYQFSPEFFHRVFSEKYGMKVCELYLAKVGSPSSSWTLIEAPSVSRARQEFRFQGSEQVYIITLVKKIESDPETRLLFNYPQQCLYEEVHWKQS